MLTRWFEGGGGKEGRRGGGVERVVQKFLIVNEVVVSIQCIYLFFSVSFHQRDRFGRAELESSR